MKELGFLYILLAILVILYIGFSLLLVLPACGLV